jgi:cysteine-rich repeat protein
MRCTTIICPDLCEGVVCDDGHECTRDRCDPLTGLCSNDPAPDGIACNDCNNTCVSGLCTGPDWVGAISGTDLSFAGSAPTTPLIDLTLVNPYDEDISAQLTGQFNVNQSSYEGLGTDDVLTGTNLGDFLLVQDPVGTQRICGVETILAQNNFDAFVLADDFIVLGDMVIEGGNASDWLWANAGDDTLRGNNGVDWLDGGPGNDIVEGGTGDDRITIWPGSGFDSISGGDNTDTVEIDAIESQILITPAADPAYELDISYLGTPMAQIREVELIVIGGVTIDVATCTGSAGDVCNLCGNDALNGGEECDDGNNVDGDGCAADCTAEY